MAMRCWSSTIWESIIKGNDREDGVVVEGPEEYLVVAVLQSLKDVSMTITFASLQAALKLFCVTLQTKVQFTCSYIHSPPPKS